MITSKDVIGPQVNATETQHVYASLVNKDGKEISVSLLHPTDKTVFEIQGKTFERTKERDEHSRIVFREVVDVEVAPDPVPKRK